jgi:hypothetical protein
MHSAAMRVLFRLSPSAELINNRGSPPPCAGSYSSQFSLGEPDLASGWSERSHSVADGCACQASPDPPIPYRTRDLDPLVHTQAGPPGRVRCYYRGCERWLRPPTRHFPGDLCPGHLIRCHGSTGGATYSYDDVRRNIIAGADLLAERIICHPFKYESDRLGFEKSEDALSWNVFRSLQGAGSLQEVAAWLTGLVIPEEPRLYRPHRGQPTVPDVGVESQAKPVEVGIVDLCRPHLLRKDRRHLGERQSSNGKIRPGFAKNLSHPG